MAARPTRRHSQRTKATAVATAERLQSAEAASLELGIPARTIRRWRDDPELADIVRKTREETAEDVTAAMHLSWARLIERLSRDEIETRDLIILAGVATDKAQLLTGKPTERTEQVRVTDGFDDHEKRALADILRGELARRNGRPAPPDAQGAGVAGPPATEADPA